MEEKPPITEIKTNIIHYLYVSIGCVKCHERSLVSLETLRDKGKVACPNCKSTMTFLIGQNVGDFALAFHRLYEQLKKISPYLLFCHSPMTKR